MQVSFVRVTPSPTELTVAEVIPLIDGCAAAAAPPDTASPAVEEAGVLEDDEEDVEADRLCGLASHTPHDLLPALLA